MFQILFYIMPFASVLGMIMITTNTKDKDIIEMSFIKMWGYRFIAISNIYIVLYATVHNIIPLWLSILLFITFIVSAISEYKMRKIFAIEFDNKYRNNFIDDD